MNTYTKFLIRTFLLSFLNVFFIFFCLIYVLNLLTELEFFKQTDVRTYFPLYLSLINTPMFVFEMFPFIFLISTQFFFNTLFTDNEMNIFKYSGLRNTKIFFILAMTTFFVGLIIISLFYNLSSNLKNLYLGLKSNYTEDKKYLAVITNNGLWIKDIYNENILMINASSFDDNELINTYISEFDKNFEIIRNIKSKKINITNKEWIIKDAEIYVQNNREIVKSLKLKTNFDYKLIQNLFSNMSSLSFMELTEMRKNYKRLNYSLTEIDLQLLKLISFPFYFILMFIFSGIIMMNTKTFKNKSLKIIIGLFLSVIIYYVNNFFYVLGTSEKINVFNSVFIPLTILTIINFFLMRNINAK
ncbi:LptF/LptG family permease [Candidatus Pelagibacter sp.]|uniref:LptF/LptG family permease n=1 Tax=Candidatus Pelagibacter sp. TaxID=2024849 RepID=UPI003F8788AF